MFLRLMTINATPTLDDTPSYLVTLINIVTTWTEFERSHSTYGMKFGRS